MIFSVVQLHPFYHIFMQPISSFRAAQWFSAPLFIMCLLSVVSCDDTHPGTKSPQAHRTPPAVISGSKSLFADKEFVSALSAVMPPVDTTDSLFRRRKMMPLRPALHYVYMQHTYAPFWVTENGVTEAAGQLLKDLDSLRGDGIDPERYHLSALTNSFNNLKAGQGNLAACIAFDTACTQSYLQASHDLLLGVLSPAKTDSLWFHSNDSVWNAPHRFVASFGTDGKYEPLSVYRSRLATYSLLQATYARYQELAKDDALTGAKSQLHEGEVSDSIVAHIIHKELPDFTSDPGDSLTEKGQLIRAFQAYYSLNPTGKMDSGTAKMLARQPDSLCAIIRANLERIRWLPQSFEDQYVLVNIPLMELFYRKDGDNAFHMRVVVGKPARQTPALNANMANVVFSPSWGVPPTILKKDVLPGISKRGNHYLASKGLHAFDRHGNAVSSSEINASNYRSFTFRQPPGARNSLGEVKFNLPNKWDIYLHDTPHRDDFARRYRAKSSGCVRVAQPKQFAEFLLKDIEGRNFDQDIIDSIIQTRHTRYETLKKKIPVHLVYLTAFEDTTGHSIRFMTDIYSRDKKLIAALNAR